VLLSACVHVPKSATNAARHPETRGRSADEACSSSTPSRVVRQLGRDEIGSAVSHGARAESLGNSLVAKHTADDLLFIFWLQGLSSQSRLSLVSSPATASLNQIRYVCAADTGSPVAAFELGTTTEAAEPIVPRALVEGFQELQIASVDSVAVFTEEQWTDVAPQSMPDSLRWIESAFKRRAQRPVMIFAFRSQQTLEQSFPIRWPDGRYSDYSLSAAGVAGVAFVARRELGFSVHELVHLVLAASLPGSSTTPGGIPYFAEEALARAVGGSQGQPFRTLVTRNDIRDARRALSHAVDQAISLDTVTFGTSAGPAPVLDLLGAVLNAALSNCEVFPFEILARSNSLTVGRAVEFLSERMRVRREAVIDFAALELTRRESVLAQFTRVGDRTRRSCAGT
jgi:hypothetical protein